MILNYPYGWQYRNQDRLVSADPAAGAVISLSNSEGLRMEPLSIDFLLTTSVAVANRGVRIELVYAALTIVIARSPIVQTAGQTKTYCAIAGASNFVDATGGYAIIGMPQRFCVPVGGTLQITADSLDAGDDFTAARMIFLGLKELA